jgi:glutaredoxin
MVLAEELAVNKRLNGTLRKILVLLAVILAMPAMADTVYKSIGPDGKVVYSDKPPADDGKLQKTLDIRNLPATPLPESVLRFREQVLKSIKSRTADAGKPRDASKPVLFMAQWCGYCKKAEAYLAERHIAHDQFDIDTPSGMRAMVEAGLSGGIPILLLGHGQKLRGFTKAAYDSYFGAGG